MVRHKQRKAEELAELIQARRRQCPRDPLHLMGISAGTAVIVFALEQLPPQTRVDSVVLFAPSISATYDLSDAMAHVNGCLYATSSPRDGILSGLGVTADGSTDSPAGLHGLRIPARVKRYEHYARVVNLAWRAAYADLGWNGSHTGASTEAFVREVIAPRVLSTGVHPLNRPMAPLWISQWRGS
jgi:alpha-beta hydrolase superfamily lysophospholipase